MFPPTKKRERTEPRSPANTMKTVFRIPSSWGFVQFVKDAMVDKTLWGWWIHWWLHMKMFVSSGASRVYVEQVQFWTCQFCFYVLWVYSNCLATQRESLVSNKPPLEPRNTSSQRSHLSSRSCLILSTWPPTSLIRLIRGLFSHGNELARREAAKLGRWNLLCRLERTVRSSSSLVSSSLFTSSLNWPLGRHHQHQCLCRTITLMEFKVFYHRSLAGAAHDGVPQT